MEGNLKKFAMLLILSVKAMIGDHGHDQIMPFTQYCCSIRKENLDSLQLQLSTTTITGSQESRIVICHTAPIMRFTIE